MRITVGDGRRDPTTQIRHYPVVRQDGRIVMVEEEDSGVARVMRLGARRVPEQDGEDYPSAAAAIEAAKARLLRMV